MSNRNKGLVSLCVPLLIILALFSGCENPGSVGGELVDNSQLVFDTLEVSELQELTFNGYSGQTATLPIGKYNDPVFGDISLKGLIKPTIQDVSVDSGGDINSNHVMKLKFSFDSTNSVYGDTLAQSDYTLYAVTENWRGKTWKLNDSFTYDESQPLATFSFTDEKEVIVDLPESFKNSYAEYFNNDSLVSIDSVYSREFHGLAIIPDEGNNNIHFSQMAATDFLVINTVDEDTSVFNAGDWAYSLSRTATAEFPAGTTPLYNTAERVMRLDTSALSFDYFRQTDFTSAQLVFFEEDGFLEANKPPNHVRLGVNNLNMDIGFGIDLLYELQFGAVEKTGFRNDTLNKYTFDITDLMLNYIYGSENTESLYIGIGSGSGQMRSTLIYNQNAPEAFRPKIVVSSIREDNQ